MRWRPLPPLLLTVALGCGGLAARAEYNKGQQAERAGELEAALGHYRAAVAAEPKPTYAEAARALEVQMLSRTLADAEAAHDRGELREARARLDEALSIRDDAAVEAHRAYLDARLARVSARELHAAASRWQQLAPRDPRARRAEGDARADAAEALLTEARRAEMAGAWTQAAEGYRALEALAPSHWAVRSEARAKAEAKALEAEGDALLEQGDALGAADKYGASLEARSDRGVKRKLARAKRAGRPALARRRRAERAERSGDWSAAADLWTDLAALPSADDETRARAERARLESSRRLADAARRAAERGRTGEAVEKIDDALEHTDAGIDALRDLRRFGGHVRAERLDEAHAVLEAAKAGAGATPVYVAAQAILDVEARRAFDAARAEARRDPAKAMVALRRLEPLAARLGGVRRLQKSLRKQAFGKLLEEARAEAGRGRFASASENLATALDVAQAPAPLEEKLEAAMRALGARKYDEARGLFEDASRAYPKSRLARAGAEIGRAARIEALRDRARTVAAAGDPRGASEAWRALLEVAPRDPEAERALADLRAAAIEASLATARAHAAAGRYPQAYLHYTLVLDEHPGLGAATTERARVAARLPTAAPTVVVAPFRLSATVDSGCVGAERQLTRRLSLYLSKAEGLEVRVLTGGEREEALARPDKHPGLALEGEITDCRVKPASAELVVRWALTAGGEARSEGEARAGFDPRAVPKDELEGKGAPKRIAADMAGTAAARVVKALTAGGDRPSLAALAAEARLAMGAPEEAVVLWAQAMKGERPNPATKASLDRARAGLAQSYR